VCNWICIL